MGTAMAYVNGVTGWLQHAGVMWMIVTGLALATIAGQLSGQKKVQEYTTVLCVTFFIAGLGMALTADAAAVNAVANWGPHWAWAFIAWFMTTVIRWADFSLGAHAPKAEHH
jgi:hypothetical protein